MDAAVAAGRTTTESLPRRPVRAGVFDQRGP